MMLMWARKQLCSFQQQPHSPEALLVQRRVYDWGGGVHLRPDARQRAEQSPESPQAVAEVRGRGKEGGVGGREEQRDLWWVTPTSCCLSSSRTKGRVLFLTPMGAGDNNVLGFHRLVVGSHILGLRVLVLDSHKTSLALLPRPTLRLSPPRPGHMLATSRLPRGV